MSPRSRQDQIRDLHQALYRAWGRPHWWPADTRFEVIVGAFLTQNTAWTNVERALANLRAAGMLSMDAIRGIPVADLERLVRPSGYFRQKAQRLKSFVAFVDQRYGGSLEKMFAQPTSQLRPELLSLNGVGPETADSILLYAGNHEVFVVDAYTRRILDRHGILPASAHYEEVRGLIESAISADYAATLRARSIGNPTPKEPAGAHHSPSAMSEEPRSPRAQVFNDLHGLIVGVGKNYCQARRVQCQECPLEGFLTAPVKIKVQAKNRRSNPPRLGKMPRK